MRKLIAFILCALLLMQMPALAAQSAHDLALEQVKVCAFSAEYNNGGRDFVARWTDDIKVYIEGSYTNSDLAFFYSFIKDLADNVPGMPSVSIVNSEGEANVNMYFIKYNQMSSYLDNYTEGNWGYFTFWWNGFGNIDRAKIGIAYDKCDQEARNHLMMEEFIGMLGLANDHYLDSRSILYQKWTTVQKLTEADWIMLRMLYNDKIRSGMKYNEAINVMKNVY